MAASFAGRRQEGLQAGLGHIRLDEPSAEDDDVSVIMLTCQFGSIGFMDQGGANFAMAVGRDAHPDARAADQNALLRPAVADRLGEKLGIVGIIHRIDAVGAQIKHLIAAIGQIAGEGLLQFITAMVAGHGDWFRGIAAHFHPSPRKIALQIPYIDNACHPTTTLRGDELLTGGGGLPINWIPMGRGIRGGPGP